MKKLKTLFVATALVSFSTVSLAADALSQLKSFVAKVDAASGQFEQQTTDESGQAQPKQSGDFAFQRPGKFRWAVQQPYEQLIVADGQAVYQYDPDLLQATKRPIDDAVGASPAAILFGSGKLEEHFQLSNRPSEAQVDWLRATPKGQEAGFNYVDIGFRNQRPVELRILDSFGHTTRIQLSELNTQPQLPANSFVFDAPEGVDLVDMH